jgi:hypothetical protein
LKPGPSEHSGIIHHLHNNHKIDHPGNACIHGKTHSTKPALLEHSSECFSNIATYGMAMQRHLENLSGGTTGSNLMSSELLHNAHSILKQKDKIIEHAAERENENDQCGNINQPWKELERASALVV